MTPEELAKFNRDVDAEIERVTPKPKRAQNEQVEPASPNYGPSAVAAEPNAEDHAASNDKTEKRVVELAAVRNKNWLAGCIYGDTGKPLAILANALIALRAIMFVAFAYDELLRAPMLMVPLKAESGFKPRPVRDVDVGPVQEKLQHLGLKRISKDVVHQAVDVCAHDRPFHPVRDYLSALSWDREPACQSSCRCTSGPRRTTTRRRSAGCS
jgi:hypothetical protein